MYVKVKWTMDERHSCLPAGRPAATRNFTAKQVPLIWKSDCLLGPLSSSLSCAGNYCSKLASRPSRSLALSQRVKCRQPHTPANFTSGGRVLMLPPPNKSSFLPTSISASSRSVQCQSLCVSHLPSRYEKGVVGSACASTKTDRQIYIQTDK